MSDSNEQEIKLVNTLSRLVRTILLMVVAIVLLLIVIVYHQINPDLFSNNTSDDVLQLKQNILPKPAPDIYWHAPDTSLLSGDTDRELILLGRDIIVHTANYFGPKGKVKANATNGMNCQNCHLDAGTKVFGNNYGSVFSTYPKYRARSGSIENIYKRVNDCFERSLNGQPLDTASREMQAIKAYINWLGKDVAKGEKAKGSGFKDIAFLTRAADASNGKIVYQAKCTSCHQQNGQGLMNAEGIAYTYPPLWGQYSYNVGAGLYRMSNFAKYVKYNMPLGADFENPQLSDEEAWDVAAFVNSQPRPNKDLSKDWPNKEEKPFDHPFGPYADKFSEHQHKFGPYQPIIDTINARKQRTNTKS
jgi:thiosulfate dehydrogenase